MATRSLWQLLPLTEDVNPEPCFRHDAHASVLELQLGSIPFWGNLAFQRGDLLLSSGGRRLLTERAVVVLEQLGGLEFEKKRIRVFQHPKWTRRTPPWRDNPGPNIRLASSVDGLPSREYYGVKIPEKMRRNYVDWASTDYGSMSRQRLSDEFIALVNPRLIEPARGFPKFFVVVGTSGFLVTKAGRKAIEDSGLRLEFIHPLVGGVQWAKSVKIVRSKKLSTRTGKRR